MYFSTKYIVLGFIYNIGIYLTQLGLKCLAPFNAKILLGEKGRLNTFNILQNNIEQNDKTLWFHCASLGEYEQGLPVFKELRRHYKNHKIVLSFFSPSGYEIRKKTPIADVVVYLPIDTKLNAQKFINVIRPDLTVFVKYDIWPNFLSELKNKGLRAILISAAFRESQSFFKFYGGTLRKALFAFEHIFTQNDISKKLLESINYKTVTVSGDTRFDRVLDQLKQDNQLDFVEKFKQEKLCVVAGSTWPEDEELLVGFINKQATNNVKFIIAPHNIKTAQILKLKHSINVQNALLSTSNDQQLQNAQVLIIDTIGLLAKIYSYADIAFVGGAVGTTGLHNTLEPAVFGMPIIIGNNYSKFPEAKAMIANTGMFAVHNQTEFDFVLNGLLEDKAKREQAGNSNLNYVLANKGAVDAIVQYLSI